MDSLTVDQQNSSCQSVTDMDSNSNDVGIVSLLFYMCRNIMVCFHEWKVYSMNESVFYCKFSYEMLSFEKSSYFGEKKNSV